MLKGIDPRLGRFDYYERTRSAYAIVATGEWRYWGNLILKKARSHPRTPDAR
jgi:L-fucose mutarotase